MSYVKRVLDRADIGCGFSSNGNILNMLNSSKANGLKSSGVYRVKCDGCSAFYVGETGRSVEERVKEHRNPRNKCTSAFGRHLAYNKHQSEDNYNIKVLHKQKKGLKLTLLEAFEIWKERDNSNLLNEQVNLGREPLFKMCC